MVHNRWDGIKSETLAPTRAGRAAQARKARKPPARGSLSQDNLKSWDDLHPRRPRGCDQAPPPCPSIGRTICLLIAMSCPPSMWTCPLAAASHTSSRVVQVAVLLRRRHPAGQPAGQGNADHPPVSLEGELFSQDGATVVRFRRRCRSIHSIGIMSEASERAISSSAHLICQPQGP
jgi:hypothetical protein